MPRRPSSPGTTKFDKMDLGELVHMRDQIQSAIEKRIVSERQELQARMEELSAFGNGAGSNASSAGRVALSRRPRRPHPLKGAKVPPKYVGPNGETWTGRGLAPRWLTALEKQGKKREQFSVEAGAKRKAARHR